MIGSEDIAPDARRLDPIGDGVAPVSYTHLDVYKRQAEVLRERYASQAEDPESEEFLVACEFAAGGIIRLLQMWWESEGRSESEDRFVEASVKLVARTLAEPAAER